MRETSYVIYVCARKPVIYIGGYIDFHASTHKKKKSLPQEFEWTS